MLNTNSETYLSVIALLVVLVFAVVIVIGIIFRERIRRFYIRAAELLLLVVCIVFVFWAGIAGAAAIQTYGFTIGLRGPLWIIGFAIGSFVGFTISAVFAAFFFLLIEIAENTRRTVLFFERVSNRAQQREPSL